MEMINEFSQRAKKTALLAAAQQTEGFQEFYTQYRDQVPAQTSWPEWLVDGVFTAAASDPEAGPMVKEYAKNAQSAGTFGDPLLCGAGFLIAALFLLGTHIKIHRTPDGKWELLLEHAAAQNELLEKIAEALSKMLNS